MSSWWSKCWQLNNFQVNWIFRAKVKDKTCLLSYIVLIFQHFNIPINKACITLAYILCIFET